MEKLTLLTWGSVKNIYVYITCIYNSGSDPLTALDWAKQAVTQEHLLEKHRERYTLQDQLNYDLTFAVYFNLAIS